jgi:hypothetical protein
VEDRVNITAEKGNNEINFEESFPDGYDDLNVYESSSITQGEVLGLSPSSLTVQSTEEKWTNRD